MAGLLEVSSQWWREFVAHYWLGKDWHRWSPYVVGWQISSWREWRTKKGPLCMNAASRLHRKEGPEANWWSLTWEVAYTTTEREDDSSEKQLPLLKAKLRFRMEGWGRNQFITSVCVFIWYSFHLPLKAGGKKSETELANGFLKIRSKTHKRLNMMLHLSEKKTQDKMCI